MGSMRYSSMQKIVCLPICHLLSDAKNTAAQEESIWRQEEILPKWRVRMYLDRSKIWERLMPIWMVGMLRYVKNNNVRCFLLSLKKHCGNPFLGCRFFVWWRGRDREGGYPYFRSCLMYDNYILSFGKFLSLKDRKEIIPHPMWKGSWVGEYTDGFGISKYCRN